MIQATKILSLRAAVAATVVASAAAAGLASARPGARPVEVAPRDVPVLVSPPPRDSPPPSTRWTAPSTGRTTPMPPPGGKLLEFGVASPWRDRGGRFQVAGRLSGEGVGLARVSFPDGEVLDLVETGGALVTSRPCWYPGARPSVLYAAGDGRLYRCDFDDESSAPGLAGPRREGPTRIEWGGPTAPTPDVHLADPCWPRDRRFGRVLLAVVASRTAPAGEAARDHDRLWWLRLDEPGEAVVEAGPVLDSPAVSGGRFLRSPAVAEAADGGLVLAYLCTDLPRAGSWELRAARLSFDDAGRPEAAATPAEKLADGCSTDLPPAFAADARGVGVLRAGLGGSRRMVQVALPAGSFERLAAVSSTSGRSSGGSE